MRLSCVHVPCSSSSLICKCQDTQESQDTQAPSTAAMSGTRSHGEPGGEGSPGFSKRSERSMGQQCRQNNPQLPMQLVGCNLQAASNQGGLQSSVPCQQQVQGHPSLSSAQENSQVSAKYPSLIRHRYVACLAWSRGQEKVTTAGRHFSSDRQYHSGCERAFHFYQFSLFYEP